MNEIKVNTLDFRPNNSEANLEIDSQSGYGSKKIFGGDKWNFRTSLKARLSISPQKLSFRKNQESSRNTG